MPKQKKYYLRTLCVEVEGFFRTALYDLQCNLYYLSYRSFKGIRDIKTINELHRLNVIVLPEEGGKNVMPLTIQEFEYPSDISNAIIEIENIEHLQKCISELGNACCENIQIVIREQMDNNFSIGQIANIINKSGIIHCEVVLCYKLWLMSKSILNKSMFPELFSIIVFDVPIDVNIASNDEFKIQLLHRAFSYDFETNIKKSKRFTINSIFYCESLYYNTYYHKKIFIDSKGNVKIGPVCNDVIASIYESGWHESVSSDFFRKQISSIKKDDISVCSVCEFRHMCLDTRIPLKHVNSRGWYQDTECNYNPYIAKWNGESGYRTLSECGVSVTPSCLLIDEKILQRAISEIYYT